MGLHPHGFAAVGTAALDGGLKNPRVAALQRALFTFAQSDAFHRVVRIE
jgi:hypothetical protein